MEQLTHFDEKGNAIMVDIGHKEQTKRIAVATGKIKMNQAAFDAVTQGTSKKGDVLGVARIAGIMGAKQTSNLIPLCHPLQTEKIQIEFSLLEQTRSIQACCTVQVTGKTGVEMEALCGVNLALLTIYDMCKALDKSMEMYDISLKEKQGGKSGTYQRGNESC